MRSSTSSKCTLPSAKPYERMGEWIERIGWPKFFQVTGIEFTRYHIDDFKNAGTDLCPVDAYPFLKGDYMSTTSLNPKPAAGSPKPAENLEELVAILKTWQGLENATISHTT